MGLSDNTVLESSTDNESTTSVTSKKRTNTSGSSPNKTKRLRDSTRVTRSSAKQQPKGSLSSLSQPIFRQPAMPDMQTATTSTANIVTQSAITVTAPPGVLSDNPFAPLSELEEMEVAPTAPVRTHKPPPIYVKNVQKYSVLCTKLSEIVGNDTFTCKARITDLVINPKTVESYRGIIRYLKERKADYHTFQLEEEKSYRVVIRNLHQSIPVELIKEELTELGHTVRNVTPVIHPVTKQTLPLFFVDLEPRPNNKDIFDIEILCYSRIKVEEPHKQRLIVQCKRCQEYGHTKSYCQHQPRCVKCAGDHFTPDCGKQPNTPATCALCNGEHPANYKGCIVHRELQRSRRQRPVYEHPSAHRRTQHPADQPPPAPQVPRHFPSFNPVNKNMSFARVAAGPQPPLAPPPLPIPSNSGDINSLLSSFLSDFKLLIGPLITLLTTVVSRLLPNQAP